MKKRPVDRAMKGLRAEKVTVRKLWLDKIREYHSAGEYDCPLYLTLPGADGHDVQMLIDNGLLERTESGAIKSDHLGRVVAVEASLDAARQLQEKFPGLKILEKNVKDLIRGPKPIRWPEGEDRDQCRAIVVNLDLDETLTTTDGATFPTLELVSKFVTLHADPPAIPKWTLLLTVHGEIHWTNQALEQVCNFLVENFGREPKFSEHCRVFLGEGLFAAVSARSIKSVDLSREDQQRLLMVLVPKKIAELVHGAGWEIQTKWNLRYGTAGDAPMTTWVMDFIWSKAGKSTPEKLYREALLGVLANQHSIDQAGKLDRSSIS